MRQSLVLSVVVPTRNEEQNVQALTERIVEDLDGINYEIVFVDDSTDRTPDIIGKLMVTHKNIRLIHRRGEEQKGGLATAVVQGFKKAEGRYICRLDGDGQHPPEAIVRLLQKVKETDGDIVIASRNIQGSSDVGLDGLVRKFISLGSRWLAQIIFSETRRISDLGELYLFKREVIEGIDLYPGSFKMILSLLVQGHWKTVAEIPYAFQKRHSGKSKASFKQGLNYLRHILQLLWRVPHSGRFWKFGLVGGVVALVGIGLLYVFVDILSIEKNVAYFAQAVVSLQLNFNLNDRFTWVDRRGQKGGYWSRWAKYHLMRMVSVILNQILFALLTAIGIHYILVSVICIVAATGINYFTSDRFVFNTQSSANKTF